MEVIPKMLLRVQGKVHYPGQPAEINDAIALKLKAAGMVETATRTAPERTVRELRADLKRRGLSTRGNKEELLKRAGG